MSVFIIAKLYEILSLAVVVIYIRDKYADKTHDDGDCAFFLLLLNITH